MTTGRGAPVRLLVLSGGTHVGQNVLATLAHRRRAVSVTAASSVCDEPGLFDFDAVHLVPPVADPAFEPALLRLLDTDRIDLVIPCRDDDVSFVAGLHDRRPDLATRLLCGTQSMARTIGDKWSSHAFCTAHRLPFAETIAACGAAEQAAFVHRHGFPLIAKPRRGWASMHVMLVNTPLQLERALARPGFVVQPFLGDPATMADFLATRALHGVPIRHDFQGVKESIQALIEPDGRVSGVFAMELTRDRRRSKRVAPSCAPDALDIGMRTATAFAAAGWRGPLNLQCRRFAGGALRIHEFSGRFTGATVDRWLLGHDEVGAAIEAFTGRPLAFDHPPPPPAGEAFETSGFRAVIPAATARLARDGVWRRAP